MLSRVIIYAGMIMPKTPPPRIESAAVYNINKIELKLPKISFAFKTDMAKRTE